MTSSDAISLLLPFLPPENWQRMCLRIQHELVHRPRISVNSQEVRVLDCLRQEIAIPTHPIQAYEAFAVTMIEQEAHLGIESILYGSALSTFKMLAYPMGVR